MLVFSYGVPKSGSTLAFELARGVAWLDGHRQALPGLCSPGHRVNFLHTLDAAALPALALAAAGRIVLVKTHACPDPDWIAAYCQLAARGAVAAHVNHRDPRDICLAPLDAGALARARGDRHFAEFATLADAEASVQRHLEDLAAKMHDGWRTRAQAVDLM